VRHRRLYLDTSAYLCILLAEDGWERPSEDTAGSPRRDHSTSPIFERHSGFMPPNASNVSNVS
jgi:hypothetical protein